MVICLEQDADLHVAQLMPLPLTVSCFSKIQIGFTFLVPAHPGSPGKRAVKWVCVLSFYDKIRFRVFFLKKVQFVTPKTVQRIEVPQYFTYVSGLESYRIHSQLSMPDTYMGTGLLSAEPAFRPRQALTHEVLSSDITNILSD